MKTDNNALLAFFFSSSVALSALTTAELVFDSDGDLLNNRGNYYLRQPGYGGKAIEGDVVDKKSDGSCSLAVVLKLSYKGWSTNIASPYFTLHVTTDYPLWISFAQLPIGSCAKKSQWLVSRVIGFGEPVMVGDANEFPVPLSGWFKIKPYDSAKFHYKLVFCYEDGKCGHVSVKTDSNDHERLVVTENEKVEPLVLKFVKATTDDVVASHVSMVV